MTTAFISEFFQPNFDNYSSQLEIAIPTGADPEDYHIVVISDTGIISMAVPNSYNDPIIDGARDVDSGVNSVNFLDYGNGLPTNVNGNGYDYYYFTTTENNNSSGFRTTKTDAIALMGPNNEVLQFLSTGPAVTVTDPGAWTNLAGMTSTSLGYVGATQSWYHKPDGTYVSAAMTRRTLNTLQRTDTGPPCFAEGSLIKTDNGYVKIENLSEGDMVETLDSGSQAIKWIGSSEINLEIEANKKHAPILVSKGSMSESVPFQDLYVSPNHAVYFENLSVELISGEMCVFVLAKHLTARNDIFQTTNASSVKYFHLLFDKHEVIYSNGLTTESFYPGQLAVHSYGTEVQNEIFALLSKQNEFGEIEHHYTPAFPVLDNQQSRVVVDML